MLKYFSFYWILYAFIIVDGIISKPKFQSNFLFKNAELKDSFKAPIIGSDDEILQPLIETEAEKNDRPFTISSFSNESSFKTSKKSRRSKKKSMTNWYEEMDSLNKMNIVFKAVPVKASPGQAAKFVAKQDIKVEQKSIKSKNDFMFESPFGKEVDDDFDYSIFNTYTVPAKPDLVIFELKSSASAPKPTVIFDSSSSNSSQGKENKSVGEVIRSENENSLIKPGSVIVDVSKNSSLKPGTVIVDGTRNHTIKLESSTVDEVQFNGIKPGTIITSGHDNYNVHESNKPLIDEQQQSRESENLKPEFNQNISSPNTITGYIPTQTKQKSLRSLDEYSIESLAFDPSYLGPKIDLDTEIDVQFVSSILIPYFKSGKLLDRKSSYSVIKILC